VLSQRGPMASASSDISLKTTVGAGTFGGLRGEKPVTGKA
jgi:hypothetical protein